MSKSKRTPLVDLSLFENSDKADISKLLKRKPLNYFPLPSPYCKTVNKIDAPITLGRLIECDNFVQDFGQSMGLTKQRVRETLTESFQSKYYAGVCLKKQITVAVKISNMDLAAENLIYRIGGPLGVTPTVYDFFIYKGANVIIRQLLPFSLTQYLNQNVSTTQLDQVAEQLVMKLYQLHRNMETLHCNLNPNNILIDENESPYLVDFENNVKLDQQNCSKLMYQPVSSKKACMKAIDLQNLYDYLWVQPLDLAEQERKVSASGQRITEFAQLYAKHVKSVYGVELDVDAEDI